MKIPKPLADLLNQQINHELEAYYAYLAMAAWSESEDYPGIATWMKNQAQEELFHMMKLFNFLADAGVTMEMKALAAPQNKFKSVEEMFKAGLKHEETQSQRFYKLQALALKHNSYHVQNELQWFISEQVEEEASFNAILRKISRLKDHPAGMVFLDQELGQRPVPTPPEAE
jgi:ferritin